MSDNTSADDNQDDDSKCELLGGIVSYSIQLLLGIAAIGSLLYKRHIEKPQRPWLIWAFDVGKQLVGGFLVHCMNIIVASMNFEGDECAWYFINFFVDCTLGVVNVYVVHESICRLARRRYGRGTALYRIGEYGNPPSKIVWAKQCCAYVTAIIVNKALVVILLKALEIPMKDFGDWLFGPLQSNPNAELVVVMVLCPWLLTSLQFWIFDIILKAEDEGKDNSENEGPYSRLDDGKGRLAVGNVDRGGSGVLFNGDEEEVDDPETDVDNRNSNGKISNPLSGSD